MKKINHVLILIVVVTIALSAAIGFFIIFPIIEKTYTYYLENRDAEVTLTSVEEERDLLISLNKNKNEVDVEHYKISTFLPDKLNSSDFVLQLDAIVKSHSLNQNELSIPQSLEKSSDSKTPSNTSTLKENPFSITETGKFSDLIAFLKDFESMSRYNSIGSIDVEKTDPDLVSAKINGVIYFKPSVTITESIDNLRINSSDKNLINSLVHFGGVITVQAPNTINNNRAEPFN